jgi:Low psii accumulation1 / Rep27
MAELKPKSKPDSIDPELWTRLQAEAKSPFRGLRQFVYVSCALSGAIGGVVFFFKLLAGKNLEATIPNLALQIGVVAVMVWLFKIDRAKV